jgi:hypothetical protein
VLIVNEVNGQTAESRTYYSRAEVLDMLHKLEKQIAAYQLRQLPESEHDAKVREDTCGMVIEYLHAERRVILGG